METWMAFESGEAEYLERIRYRGQQHQQPERRPARALRSAVATALVALASRIAPALPELSPTEAPPIRAPQP
jgi:hypothetical protein